MSIDWGLGLFQGANLCNVVSKRVRVILTEDISHYFLTKEIFGIEYR